MLGWCGWAAREAGRGGSYQLKLTLRGMKDVGLVLRDGFVGLVNDDANAHRSLQGTVQADVIAEADRLREEPIGAALELLKKVSNAFDYNYDENWLSKAQRVKELPPPTMA